MKKLPWIIMGLLFLSGIGMIAWSLFPMPVKLISGKLTGDKPEKMTAETSANVPESDVIEISEDGFTVIEPETTEESGGKEEKLSEAAVFVPQTDPDQVENTGNYTLPEKAEMKDGSIGILTIEAIGVSAPVYETDDEMEAMRKGIAHYKTTSAWSGNIGLCAHNGTASYCWFHDLHKLEKGDVVTYQTALGTRTYEVSEIKEIEETDWSMLGRTEDNRIANTPMSTLEIRKVDSVTGKPLSGITFEVEKLSGERIGTFVTDAAGRIVIPDLTPQWVVVRETKTRPGYKLDPDPVNVEIKSGKTTVVKFQNQPYPVLDLLKVDAETGKPMEGVQFRLLDSQKREIGVFTTNRNGRITLTGLDGGTTVYWQEVETLEGYELDESLHKVSLQWGKTSKITIENEKIYGCLEILKVAADGSALAKVDAGDSLAGAVFEIYNKKGKLVDRITTDENGKAVTKKLPIGEYTGKEVTAPKFFLLNDQIFSFKIKKQDQTIKVTIQDDSKKPEVEIEKRGNVEAMPGQEMSYTLSNIRNNSNCSLDNFWFEDVLPTDAVRIAEIHTGTFNEILTYRITYRTNLSSSYRVLADNLSTQVNHDISCTIPGLAANEYITAVRFEFGTVQKGFANEMNPVLDVNVLPDLPDGYRIQNNVTISGTCDGVPVYDKDYWVTVIVRVPDKPLPKTGIWE